MRSLNAIVKTGTDTPPAGRAPNVGTRQKHLLMAATMVATLATGVWVVAVVMSAGHGFDTTDEGFYLLSDRWWNTNVRTFTGFQYFYGPVFQILGHDIVAFRIFRLITILAVHSLFGWTFMRWLRQRRQAAPATRWWEAAGTAAIVACGGMAYSWLPLSPSYNDLELLGSLLLATIVLRIAAECAADRRVSAWIPAATGPVAVVMVIGKWVGVLTIGLVGLGVILIVAPHGRRYLARVLCWALAGTAVSAGLFHLLIFPLDQAIPPIIETTRLIGATSYPPSTLLAMYGTTTWNMVVDILTRHGVLVVTSILAVFIPKRWFAVPLCFAWVVTCWQLLREGGAFGGATPVAAFSESMLLVLIVAIATGAAALARQWFTSTRAWPTNIRTWSSTLRAADGWVICCLLGALPAAQGFGTNNPLIYVAINAFAAWAALMIAISTAMRAENLVASSSTMTAVAVAVALSAVIAVHTTWQQPYRGVGRQETTRIASGVVPLRSIKLAPSTALTYHQLNELLRPYTVPEGRVILGFDEMAGIVFLLNGRTMGEGWYSANDPARTATGIRAECHDRHGPFDSRPPILIFNRPVTDLEIDALQSCGLTFDRDYTVISPPGGIAGLTVYVPTAEVPTSP